MRHVRLRRIRRCREIEDAQLARLEERVEEPRVGHVAEQATELHQSGECVFCERSCARAAPTRASSTIFVVQAASPTTSLGISGLHVDITSYGFRGLGPLATSCRAARASAIGGTTIHWSDGSKPVPTNGIRGIVGP